MSKHRHRLWAPSGGTTRSLLGTLADLYAGTFRPPYNYLTRFRDPGRININTIFDAAVGEGLLKGDPSYDPTLLGGAMFARILQSRRGYAW